MATITLRLSTKKEQKTGQAEILIRFRHGPIDLYAKSGVYIEPKYWSRENIAVPNARIITDELRAVRKSHDTLTRLMNLISKDFLVADKDSINKEWLELIIDKYHFPEKYAPKPVEQLPPATLFEYVTDFIAKAPTRKDKQTGRLLTKGSTTVYKTMFGYLKEFAKSQKKKDYTFEELNMKFYNAFVGYLQAKGFTANTVGKVIKELKTVLKQAERDGINRHTAYRDFTVFTEEVDNIYLTEDELSAIRNADLRRAPKEIQKLITEQGVEFSVGVDEHSGEWRVYEGTLDKVRDWFLLLAWSGSRFSDLEKITQQEVKSGYISFRQQKTNSKVVIPIHPVVREIFEKYDFNLPAPISNQKFNHYLKIVCLLAGITSTETKTRTEGGLRKTTTTPKWAMVSSHTGRRSFCTNMYKRGLPTLTIMAISGHTTEKSFLRYIKVNQEEHAKMMMAEWEKFYK